MDHLSSPAADGRPLIGQVVAFTGKLSSLGRREAHALVVRLGGASTEDVTTKTTMLVVGAGGPPSGAIREPGATDVDEGEKTLKLKKAEQINRRSPGQIRVISEDELCRLADLPTPESLKQQYYGFRDALGMYPVIREDHLRYLQKFGLIQPVLRTKTDAYLRFSDLAIIRQAAAELERGVSFRAVLRSLQASQSGQLAFNFRLDAEPARVIELRRSEPAPPAPVLRAGAAVAPSLSMTPAEKFFLDAFSLDKEDQAAAAGYRKALEADPHLVAALINLANIHYAHDELVEAHALYERAIALEPDFFEAHFNLGNVYHDLGRYREAALCYRDALALNPRYPDAHFYLAVTCEKMGHSQDARPHWRAYQQLAPHGEWVELAREFSE